ncbi:hypothetical protein [Methyloversatilis sp. XJ19-49]|uniref:hypothetical protein n=1 Tax=Methyloversatilis sp. XJ19-49 TaxID=2963429 RepID=UPI00211C8E29|nr:hypothetical protein [Methyloversatilis sp. XJ19-49]MCQ9378276.1 hypothetical protein [Methyloversatilis sp. XJ19-49]
MTKFFTFCVCLLSAFVVGCSHKGVVRTVSATNVYSGHDEKHQKPVTYLVDDTSLTKLQKDDAVKGFLCGGHRFPVDAGEAFVASVPSLMESVFDDFSQSGAAQQGKVQFVFRIERFDPRVKFTDKFFSADADATVDLGISVVATLDGRRVFGTAVDTQRSKSGDAGPMCAGGAEVLSDAMADAIKDVLEKAGERIANSQQLRELTKRPR